MQKFLMGLVVIQLLKLGKNNKMPKKKLNNFQSNFIKQVIDRI